MYDLIANIENNIADFEECRTEVWILFHVAQSFGVLSKMETEVNKSPRGIEFEMDLNFLRRIFWISNLVILGFSVVCFISGKKQTVLLGFRYPGQAHIFDNQRFWSHMTVDGV